MYIKFLNGSLYSYAGVLYSTFVKTRNADLAGSFFCKNIRGYKCEKIENLWKAH
jgi:hypothetical protein